MANIPESDKRTFINKRVSLYDKTNHRHIYINDYELLCYKKEDYFIERLAIVLLYNAGLCKQVEMTTYFGCHRNTISNYVRDYRKNGLLGLLKKKNTSQTKVTFKIRDDILSFDYNDPNITYQYVVDKIKEKYNTELHQTTIMDIIKGNTHKDDMALKSALWGDQEKEKLLENENNQNQNDDDKEDNEDTENNEISKGTKTLNNTDKPEDNNTTNKTNEDKNLKDKNDSGDTASSNKDSKSNSKEDREKEHIPQEQKIKDENIEENENTKEEQQNNIIELKETGQEKASEIELKNRLKGGIISCYGAAFIFFAFLKKLNLIKIFKTAIKENLDGNYLGYSYNLTKFIITLLFLIIFRFPSFERFKTVNHKEFSPLIGYNRAPSVKVIRKRFNEIAQLNVCNQSMDDLAKAYLKCGLIKIGVLYLDAHCVPYYGMLKTPKKFFTTRNLALKAEQQIYVNGAQGRPFFFKLNDGSKQFMDLIPEITDHAKKLIKENTGRDAPLIFVFDRELFSVKLFKELTKKEVIFISWRKWDKKVSKDKFDETITWQKDEDTTLHYKVYRRQIKVGKQNYPLEAVSFYCEEDKDFDPETDKAPTLIANINKFNPDDYKDFNGLSNLDLILFICGRWKQENFFKIMKNDYAIDHHPDYEFEELMPQPMVKNPALKKIKKEIRQLKKERTKIDKKLANKFSNSCYNDKSLKHYQNLKTSNRLLERKQEIETKIQQLKREKKESPEKVPFNQVSDEEMNVRAVRRKLFLDILKTAVYNLNELALETFSNHYDNQKDIRVIFNKLINSTTHLKLENKTLVVSIQKPERPKYRKAIRGFLEELNELNVKDFNGLADRIKFRLTDVIN
jgi:transposase